MHAAQGWLAVADLHYGYELHRSRQGALLPDWGMAQCEAVLIGLIRDYEPRRLILVGDIMDGSGSAAETATMLQRIRPLVPELVCIEGNHDRPALRKGWTFVASHEEPGFVFHHGHRWETMPTGGDEQVIHITGHEHPAIHLRDGAGLRLKLPALVQQRLSATTQHWILPAFSPWAAGGEYASAHARIATWVCASQRVWSHHRS